MVGRRRLQQLDGRTLLTESFVSTSATRVKKLIEQLKAFLPPYLRIVQSVRSFAGMSQ
jgi:hypothetical protein